MGAADAGTAATAVRSRVRGCLASHGWLLPHLALLMCQISYSVMHVTSKSAVEYIPPMLFAALRISMSLPLLGLVARLEPVPEGTLTWRDHFWWMLMGANGVAGPQIMVFVGNLLAGPDIVAVLQPTIPVYVSLFSMLVGVERPSAVKAAAVSMAVLGALVVLRVESLDLSKSSSAGTAVMVVQSALYASFLLALQHVLKRRPYPFNVFFRAVAYGSLFSSLLALLDLPSMAWAVVPASAWLTVVYSGVCVSFGAHGLTSWAVSRCNATLTSMYICLQPPLTVVLSALVLGESFRVRDAVGMAIILLALTTTILIKLREAREQQLLAAVAAASVKAASAAGCIDIKATATGLAHNSLPPLLSRQLAGKPDALEARLPSQDLQGFGEEERLEEATLLLKRGGSRIAGLELCEQQLPSRSRLQPKRSQDDEADHLLDPEAG